MMEPCIVAIFETMPCCSFARFSFSIGHENASCLSILRFTTILPLSLPPASSSSSCRPVLIFDSSYTETLIPWVCSAERDLNFKRCVDCYILLIDEWTAIHISCSADFFYRTLSYCWVDGSRGKRHLGNRGEQKKFFCVSVKGWEWSKWQIVLNLLSIWRTCWLFANDEAMISF